MTDFAQMHIFFFVATIGFVIVAILVVVLLAYVIRFMHILNSIAETVDEETQEIKEDLDAARAKIKRGGNGLLALAGFAGKTGKRLLKKKRSS